MTSSFKNLTKCLTDKYIFPSELLNEVAYITDELKAYILSQCGGKSH